MAGGRPSTARYHPRKGASAGEWEAYRSHPLSSNPAHSSRSSPSSSPSSSSSRAASSPTHCALPPQPRRKRAARTLSVSTGGNHGRPQCLGGEGTVMRQRSRSARAWRKSPPRRCMTRLRSMIAMEERGNRVGMCGTGVASGTRRSSRCSSSLTATMTPAGSAPSRSITRSALATFWIRLSRLYSRFVAIRSLNFAIGL